MTQQNLMKVQIKDVQMKMMKLLIERGANWILESHKKEVQMQQVLEMQNVMKLVVKTPAKKILKSQKKQVQMKQVLEVQNVMANKILQVEV